MEYAIAAGVTAIFVLLYLFGRALPREEFSSALDDEAFTLHAENFCAELPLPDRSSKAPQSAGFKRSIKRSRRALKKKTPRGDDDPLFDAVRALFESEEKLLDRLIKRDFSALGGLPGIKGEARAALLAKETLSRSRYILCDDRISTMLTAANSARTLMYTEIAAMPDAFAYVLVQKLGFLAARLLTLIRLRQKAEKIARKPSAYSENDEFKRLRKNKLFLRFCADELEADGVKLEENYSRLAEGFLETLNYVLDSLRNLEIYDFSRFYRPLELLAAYPNFASAAPKTKHNFLTLMSQAAQRENLDEYAYATRLKRLTDCSRPSPPQSYFLPVGGIKLAFLKTRNDCLQLAQALSSSTLMGIFFAEKRKTKKSILKNTKINNTFAPYYEQYAANFGICVRNDRLTMRPVFPDCVDEASLVLDHNGCRHRITFKRGETEAVYVNGTQMHGIADIALGEIPLTVEYVGRLGRR